MLPADLCVDPLWKDRRGFSGPAGGAATPDRLANAGGCLLPRTPCGGAEPATPAFSKGSGGVVSRGPVFFLHRLGFPVRSKSHLVHRSGARFSYDPTTWWDFQRDFKFFFPGGAAPPRTPPRRHGPPPAPPAIAGGGRPPRRGEVRGGGNPPGK